MTALVLPWLGMHTTRIRMRILWIGAHPDDELFVSGWLAHLRLSEAAEIGLLFATRGERGGWKLPGDRPLDIGTMREHETLQAATELDATVRFAGCRDGAASEPEGVLRAWAEDAGGMNALRHRFAALVMSFAPDRIVTFDRHHGCTWHADHRAVGTLVQSLRLPIPVTLVESRLAFDEPLRIVSADRRAIRFDARATWEYVVRNVERHPSQFGPETVSLFRDAPDDARVVWLLDVGCWRWWHYLRDNLVRSWSRLKSFIRDRTFARRIPPGASDV